MYHKCVRTAEMKLDAGGLNRLNPPRGDSEWGDFLSRRRRDVAVQYHVFRLWPVGRSW